MTMGLMNQKQIVIYKNTLNQELNGICYIKYYK